jgi:two-component system response regulator DevR
MPIKILLADDSEIIRKVVADLLQGDPEIQLVAECTSLAQTMERASKLHPQVIVLDVHMGDEETVTSSQLKFGLIGSRVLAISIWNDDETKALAERMGATTLLDKASLTTALIPAAFGRFLFHAQIAAQLFMRYAYESLADYGLARAT